MEQRIKNGLDILYGEDFNMLNFYNFLLKEKIIKDAKMLKKIQRKEKIKQLIEESEKYLKTLPTGYFIVYFKKEFLPQLKKFIIDDFMENKNEKKKTNKNIPSEPTKVKIKSSQLIKEGNYQEANKQALIESGIYDNSNKYIIPR